MRRKICGKGPPHTADRVFPVGWNPPVWLCESFRELWVWSGEVPLCKVGVLTGIEDCDGGPLRTGDIVVTFTEDPDGHLTFAPSGLTCVVKRCPNCADGLPEAQEFVMDVAGIKFPHHTWRLVRVKRFEDVIEGEHWRDYGFRFAVKKDA